MAIVNKFHTDFVGRHLVISETENSKILNIERVIYEGEVILTTGTVLYGIQPGRLYQGKDSITVSADGIHTSDVFIKVLCSKKPQKLSWHPATASRLHTDFIGKHLVMGGTESGKAVNIGRVSYQGEVIVGKVCGYIIGNARMFFPYQNAEVTVSSYEVLVYNDDIDTNVLAE
ncbi:DUF3421 domain containing protein [Asbolus verrucosus]|uniref:DUF3421 domain containing protein n=1 Tax=Asbolus verrucosus TaxID=1661398 RepID=A0A482VEW2_ASBVE|nr:DUF3421 domain containing protein [Asbolus verrucosus]